MFVSVKTKEGDLAVVNSDNITHITIAAFNGSGCKIFFTSKDGLSVSDTIESIKDQINGGAAEFSAAS